MENKQDKVTNTNKFDTLVDLTEEEQGEMEKNMGQQTIDDKLKGKELANKPWVEATLDKTQDESQKKKIRQNKDATNITNGQNEGNSNRKTNHNDTQSKQDADKQDIQEQVIIQRKTQKPEESIASQDTSYKV